MAEGVAAAEVSRVKGVIEQVIVLIRSNALTECPAQDAVLLHSLPEHLTALLTELFGPFDRNSGDASRRLSLEEAYCLVSGSQLDVYHPEAPESPMTPEQCWTCFSSLRRSFPWTYAAHRHFKSAGFWPKVRGAAVCCSTDLDDAVWGAIRRGHGALSNRRPPDQASPRRVPTYTMRDCGGLGLGAGTVCLCCELKARGAG